MAQVLVLTRRDGTTETAHVGSPYLAVMFEEEFHRTPDTAKDSGWMAFYDIHDRPPADRDEMMAWLKQFVASDLGELEAEDPTQVAPNGAEPVTSSPT
jgi:hypothetical protein